MRLFYLILFAVFLITPSLAQDFSKIENELLQVLVLTEDGSEAFGSAFAINNETIITNAHVVVDAKFITITTMDGISLPVLDILLAKSWDIAVLKVASNEFLSPIDLGNSDLVEIGDEIYTYGNPALKIGTLSKGIVSNFDMTNGVMPLIQVDSLVYHGSSGGILYNSDLEIIGITSLVSEDTPRLGYAIPINLAKKVWEELLIGRTTHIFYGLAFKRSFEELNNSFVRLQGHLIHGLAEGSELAAIGLMPGDIILDINGEKFYELNSLTIFLSKQFAGDILKFNILRDKQHIEITAYVNYETLDLLNIELK